MVLTFHLGGGIKKNDGLSDLKGQFGGCELFNGGEAIVPNESLLSRHVVAQELSGKRIFFSAVC